MPYAIYWKLEQDRLQAAVQERLKVRGSSTRTFAQIVNTALYSVALKAQQYTPKADNARIDASLFVEVNLVEDKFGKLKPGRKGNKFTYSESLPPNDTNAAGEHSSMPLAYAIVLARANISKQGRETGLSRYNLLTNHRWELPKEALKGGRKKIISMMERMVSARHSSQSLLKAGWSNPMRILRPFIAKNDIGKTTPEPIPYNKKQERLGTATVAREGWKCSGMIQNNVGGGGTALDERQRLALYRYGIPAVQRALSEEAAAMEAKVAEYMARDAARFNQQVR